MKKFILDNDTLYKVIDNVDISIYWKDLNGIYGGCNRYMLDMLNIKDRDFVIGKTDYELPWYDVANILEKHDKLAVKEGYYSTEESYVNNKNEKKIYLTKKTRLLDSNGNVIGVMGTSTDITAEKKAESKNQLIRGFSQQLLRVINCFQVLNDRGKEDFDFYDTDVTLTKRETEVLYLLSRGKKPKDIAVKLGISPKTAQNVIDGQLFPKLNVYNIGELLEKAYMLNLIPLTL